MPKVKGPVGGIPTSTIKPENEPTARSKSAAATPAPASADVASQASRQKLQEEWKRLRELNELPHRQMIGGAASLFSGVYFPPNLLDTKDAKNDPKYMRLLAAILGLDEFTEYFNVASREDEDESSEDEGEDDEDKDKKPSPRRKKK